MTGGTVVILGPTGRNVGAGMSGGRAFVLDLDESLVNRDLVDSGPVTADDVELVRDAIKRHHELTDSAVAARLLADWSAGLARITAVIARDYLRVLEATHRAEADGRDVDEAIMSAAVR
jgi:glutamate synthase (NADPH/NADH) large chain